MIGDIDSGYKKFSTATLGRMQGDIEVHRRKFGVGAVSINWKLLWDAVQALMPTLLALVANGVLNVAGIPAAVAAVVGVLIALFTGAPIPSPVPISPSPPTP